MREIKALSPTSLDLFWRNTETWYLKYCTDVRLPRQQQTQPMSVGSAFDAFIKALLYEKFHGKVQVGHKFSAHTLFNAQVDEALRPWAADAGCNCLDQYQRSGALADLLLETGKLQKKPQFEFTLREKISYSGFEVPILGIPDMYYHTDIGQLVILDWKINGYCGKAVTSPAPGYIRCRDGWEFGKYKPTRTHGKPHTDISITRREGMAISSMPLEEANETWAAQVTTYAWLLGEPVGSANFVAAIEQLCGYPFGVDCPPGLRIASHRAVVTHAYQETLIGKYIQCWHAYKSGHIFLMESRQQSDEKCKFLEEVARTLMHDRVDSPRFSAAIEFLQGKDFYDPHRDHRGDIIRERRRLGEVGLPDNYDPSGIDQRDGVRCGSGLIGLSQVAGSSSNAGQGITSGETAE